LIPSNLKTKLKKKLKMRANQVNYKARRYQIKFRFLKVRLKSKRSKNLKKKLKSTISNQKTKIKLMARWRESKNKKATEEAHYNILKLKKKRKNLKN
jgi:hypothetical protein